MSFAVPGYARDKIQPPKLLFVPHDNRPISDQQTAEVVEKLGYNVVVPPKDMLGSRTDLGHPDELWQWVEENSKDAEAVVLSSDSMVYGSLVGSRKHNYEKQEVLERASRFADFRKKHPKVKLYAFGSIMRTPRSGAASGSAEPDYYANYGSDIFRYTALTDKKETEGLTRRETKEYAFLTELIPKPAMQDWMSRRQKNFAVSSYLISLVRQGTFDYFVLGRDDNAPYSQTHMESRKLAKEGADLGVSRFQAVAGIDEIALLMLTRAVNDYTHTVPFVNVVYNWGKGGHTVPSYSDEAIDASIRAATVVAGGMIVTSPRKADVVLYVNTKPNGRTGEASDADNTEVPHEGTNYFRSLLSDGIAAGYPIAVADIAYANGSDNALMKAMQDNGMLFKIRAYAGWNTATNSTGFVLGTGMLSEKMTNDDRDKLLVRRYLDDWAYQANVRKTMGRQLGWFRGTGAYASLDDKKLAVEARSTRLLRSFIDEHLPPFNELRNVRVEFPWNRMFEAEFIFDS